MHTSSSLCNHVGKPTMVQPRSWSGTEIGHWCFPGSLEMFVACAQHLCLKWDEAPFRGRTTMLPGPLTVSAHCLPLVAPDTGEQKQVSLSSHPPVSPGQVGVVIRAQPAP